MAEGTSSEPTTAALRVWASLVEGVQLRVELLALELADERRRLTELLLSAVALAVALFMLLLSLNAAVLVLLWDTHREAAAIGSCVFYAVVACGVALLHRRRSRRTEKPFSTLASVLATDQRSLRDLL